MRRNAFEVEDVSDLVDDLISGAPPPLPADESERKTPRTPHEESRAARFIGVTFPSSAWRRAIEVAADAWGLRVSDFITYCVAYTMAAIQEGRVQRPRNGQVQFHHRTGENVNLPWTPEE